MGIFLRARPVLTCQGVPGDKTCQVPLIHLPGEGQVKPPKKLKISKDNAETSLEAGWRGQLENPLELENNKQFAGRIWLRLVVGGFASNKTMFLCAMRGAFMKKPFSLVRRQVTFRWLESELRRSVNLI